MIDLDELLYGNPVWNDVVAFFKDGEFHEEHYEVAAIKRHLRTANHKIALDAADLSIEDCLNGRVPGHLELVVQAMFGHWNAKLGFKRYGY